jgi:hypothetical protein
MRHDPNSRLFPLDDAPAEALRTETGTQIPVIQAGWFMGNAARPPLYHQLLGIPARLVDLERQLGLDLSDNIASASVARAGFSESGPSRFNRIIERHTLSPERGALWITYDFSASAGTSNIFLHPLDFVPDSSELLFHLPNGFEAFMIVDAAGNRLDLAPSDAVQDELAGDRFMVNGLSCLSCHATRGIVNVADEIRESTVGAGFSPEDEALILALYREQAELDELFAGDRKRFQDARAAAAMERVSDGLLHKLDDRHRANLAIDDVAAALGITVEELEAAIDMAGANVPTRIAAMRTVPGSKVPRDSFESLFGQLVAALELGEPIAEQ